MADDKSTGKRQRVVVKIGSGCLTATGSGRVEVDRNTLFRLAAEMNLRAADVDFVVVSSGAVALGVEALGLDARPAELADVQAMAAVGQSLLSRSGAKRLAAVHGRWGRCCSPTATSPTASGS